jgi:hypothetical protein
MMPTNNPDTIMIIFSIFFIAYPIKKPKNPPIPIEVANPPIPIEVARELKSINILINYPRTIDIYNIDIFHEIIELHIVLVFLEQAYLQKFLRL